MSTTVLHQTRVAPTVRADRPTLIRRLWNALEAQGQRRAAAEMRRLATVTTDPALRRLLLEMAARTPRA